MAPNRYPQPKKCPSCGKVLANVGGTLRCHNSKCRGGTTNTELKPHKAKNYPRR